MTIGPSTAESRRRLLELIQGYRITQVLYAAASLGIAEALRGGPRGSRDLAAAVGAAGILFEGSQLYENWRELVDSVRTGQNVYQRRYGVDAWTYRMSNREWGKLFDGAMQEYSASRVAAVVDAYDFLGSARSSTWAAVGEACSPGS
jgi:hypothetical protein